MQNFELENIEKIAVERNEKIDRMVGSMKKLNELFKQMGRLVAEQGTILDRIDFNIGKASADAIKAHKELHKVLNLINI
jgi:syntaxin 16